MKSDTIKVGSKIGTEHVQVECSIPLPENTDDMYRLARKDRDPDKLTAEEAETAREFVVQMFTRGWRIWNQEQSGARDAVAASTVAERKDMVAFRKSIQTIVNDADPLAPAKRTGRPAGPREVKVEKNELQAALNDSEKLAALLAAHGVKLNIADTVQTAIAAQDSQAKHNAK